MSQNLPCHSGPPMTSMSLTIRKDTGRQRYLYEFKLFRNFCINYTKALTFYFFWVWTFVVVNKTLNESHQGSFPISFACFEPNLNACAKINIKSIRWIILRGVIVLSIAVIFLIHGIAVMISSTLSVFFHRCVYHSVRPWHYLWSIKCLLLATPAVNLCPYLSQKQVK